MKGRVVWNGGKRNEFKLQRHDRKICLALLNSPTEVNCIADISSLPQRPAHFLDKSHGSLCGLALHAHCPLNSNSDCLCSKSFNLNKFILLSLHSPTNSQQLTLGQHGPRIRCNPQSPPLPVLYSLHNYSRFLF